MLSVCPDVNQGGTNHKLHTENCNLASTDLLTNTNGKPKSDQSDLLFWVLDQHKKYLYVHYLCNLL